MKYPVRCDCGKVYQFSAVQAGTRYTCPCGRELVVPSLSRLRLAAGEEVLSPEVRLDQMLRLGLLPEQTRCVVCRTDTTGVVYFWAICERAFVKKDASRVWWVLALSWICFGWIGLLLLLVRARDDRVHGSDVRLRLPLRVCDQCAPSLSEGRRLEDAVLAVPLYADLLDKYPNAELAHDTERKGVNLSAPGPG